MKQNLTISQKTITILPDTKNTWILNYHWELSRKVDAGSTNTLIDQIFLSIEDLIDAKMVCGAGGGGFLQVILKKGVQKADVHKRLKDVFQDNPVDVWDCEII